MADPKTGLVLRPPGLDERLPGLRLLYDATAARDTIGRIEGRDPGAVAVRLVAHRLGKRAVLCFEGEDGRSRYARLRAAKGDAGQVQFARHRALWQSLSGDGTLTIPEPLGEDPALGLSLFAPLAGQRPAFSGLTGFAACRDITAAVRALQRQSLDGLSDHGAQAEFTLLEAWLARIAPVFPDLAGRVRGPLRRLADDFETLPPMAPVPTHRDLHEKQILLGEGAAGILDFDTLVLADPALDIGNLQAHLFLAGLRDGRDSSAFEWAFLIGMPELPVARARIWRRAALLRLAMIYAFSDTPPRILERLVDEARA